MDPFIYTAFPFAAAAACAYVGWIAIPQVAANHPTEANTVRKRAKYFKWIAALFLIGGMVDLFLKGRL